LNQGGIDDQEIRNRITKARKIITCPNDILWNKCITKKRRISIYETMVKSIMLYDYKIWKLTERNSRALEATKMNTIRQFMRISQREKVRNEEVKQRMVR
jgi:hypothetical protein